jgi:hypothetical protein
MWPLKLVAEFYVCACFLLVFVKADVNECLYVSKLDTPFTRCWFVFQHETVEQTVLIEVQPKGCSSVFVALPRNVSVTKNGKMKLLRLIDLDIALLQMQAVVGKPMTMLGTQQYAGRAIGARAWLQRSYC